MAVHGTARGRQTSRTCCRCTLHARARRSGCLVLTEHTPQLSPAMTDEALIIRGAREHNLKNIDVTIPRDRLTVITGLSGSGKSSLAFDTIYAEGQRRYVESLSAYARQFLGLMEKPDVDSIEGLSPAISIEQKTRRPQSAIDRRHGHGDLRLSPSALRARRHAALPELRPPRAAAERRPDHGCGARVAVGHADRDPRAARARSKGRVPRAVRVGAQAGIHSRDRRRRDRRARESAEAEQASEPRRVDHGRSARRARRKIAAASTTRSRRRSSSPTGSVEVVRHDASKTAPTLFSERYGCAACGISMPEMEPRHFSFNSPFGACPACGGLGTRNEVSEELILGDPSLSILEGVILPWGEPDGYLRRVILPGLAKQLKFDLNAAVAGSAAKRSAHAAVRGRQEGNGDGREPASEEANARVAPVDVPANDRVGRHRREHPASLSPRRSPTPSGWSWPST